MEAIVLIIFVIGYIAITMEHKINLNKAASALITATLCWTVIMLNPNGIENELKLESLSTHLGEVAGILFFLLSAMTIVELIDAHDGFQNISEAIRQQGVTRKGINIGRNCWIGSKVTILDGVTIGEGCIIAAGAVVTQSFPENSVIAGVPAKLIKSRL